MNRIYILLMIVTILSAVLLGGGYITEDKTKYRNNFIRIFPSHATRPMAVMEIAKNRYSLAGVSKSKIYLRDRSVVGGLLISCIDMTDTIRVRLFIPVESEIEIDSPYFFLKNHQRGTLQRGNVHNWCVDTTITLLSGFTAIQPISKNSSVLRTIDMQKRKNVLAKSNSFEPRDVLKKQVDGILCTDGYLQYSKEHHKVIYLYRYRNQFLCLDTILNLGLAGKTIDTTSVAKISVAELNGEIKMSRPPLVVNKGACIYGKYLFVQSNLVARNELADISKNNSVIDLYNILDGSYLFSFYVADQSNSKLQSFRVNRNVLIAIFKNHVVRYDLSKDYFQF
jgi:hypothetical protein